MKQVVLLILAGHVLHVVQCAENLPQRCGTSGTEEKYCLPRSDCKEYELIDLRTNGCEGEGLHCCEKKPPTEQIAFSECDSGKGYCVSSSLCTVRTYRTRSNRCLTLEEVCCPKLYVVGYSSSTTTEAFTAAERTTNDDERNKSIEKGDSEDVAIVPTDKPTTIDKATAITTPTSDIDFRTDASVTNAPELIALENAANIHDGYIKEIKVSTEAPIFTDRFGLTTTNTTSSTSNASTTTSTIIVPRRKSSSTIATTESEEMPPPPPATTIKPDEFSNFIPNLKPEFNGEFIFGECGQRNRYGVVESTIEEDSRAEYGEYPWMVALFQVNRENGEKRYCCNGALVETYAVLTTAHCLSICGSNHTNMVVRLGEWIMNSTVEPIPHEDIDVEQMFKHPNYTHTSLINNIAVVVLNGSVEYKPTVQPICLPSSEEELGSRTNMIATGWGTTVVQTNAGAKTPTKVLKRMDLHSEPLTNCENIIKDNRPFKLHSSFACTSTEHLERPCAGDAGAPVVIEKRPTNDRFYLYGLVSWGFHCLSEKRKETVVTKVEEFKDWIDGILNNSSM